MPSPHLNAQFIGEIEPAFKRQKSGWPIAKDVAFQTCSNLSNERRAYGDSDDPSTVRSV